MSEPVDPARPAGAAIQRLYPWPWPVAALGVLVAWLAGSVWLAMLAAALWLAARHAPMADLLDRALVGTGPWPPEQSDAGGGGRRGVWLFGALTALGLAVVILELRQPFYFSHDDNLVQFLPVILHGGDSLFAGVFPTWNAHQFLGAPTSSVGTYALTYPVTYLSYGLARFVLANENTTLEVFCVLHLFAGLVATYAACRGFGMRASLGAAVALSFVLTGYFLIVGRAWYYMLPVAVWMPCLLLALGRLADGRPSWRWVAGTGLVVGLWFHSGNVQMWFYGMTFVGLIVLVWLATGTLPWRRITALVSALLVGAGLALPLLVPQMFETAGVPRNQLGEGIGAGLWSLFVPWPLVDAPHPNAWGGVEAERMGQLYFTGTALALPALLAMLALLALRWSRRATSANIFALVAWVAFLFALGGEGYLWTLSGRLPVLDKFTQPFKYLPFLVLFGLLAGAAVTERLLREARRPLRWEVVVYAVSVTLVLYHVSIATATVTRWGFRPYPPLPQALHELDLGTSRLYTMAPERAGEPEYLAAQMHNLPTVYGLYSLGGYDPLVRDSPANVRMLEHFEDRPTYWVLQAYGVHQVLLYVSEEHRRRGRVSTLDPVNKVIRSQDRMREVLLEDGAARRTHDDLEVLTLPHPTPMAFTTSERPRALPVRFDGAGATVDTGASSDEAGVIVNVLWRPFLKAYADGRAVEAKTDEWGRVRLEPPQGTKSLRLRYEPPWRRGVVFGLVAIAVGLGIHGLSGFWGEVSRGRGVAGSRGSPTQLR